MDYAIEMQRIIDALREDREADPKWRNKIAARLEELQAFTLMLYEGISFDVMPDVPVDNTYGPQPIIIPPELRQFASTDQINRQPIRISGKPNGNVYKTETDPLDG